MGVSFKGGKHSNSKTGLSFDTTTICPLTRAGKPCAYCYVNTERKNGGYLKKGESEFDRYDGWVLRLRQETVDSLNMVGGVRMFGFGDYVVKHRREVEKFLNDCDLRDLKAKAITKQTAFVEHFHDHPMVTTVHCSIDNLKGSIGRSPITHPKAKQLRELYDKVKVRSVVLNDEDLEYFGQQAWVDILTFNHVINGFKLFSRAEIKAAAERFPGRVCCAADSCATCQTKCGLFEHPGDLTARN